MNDSQFHKLADTVFVRIEDTLDNCDFDIDYQKIGSVFYIYLPSGTKLVLNKQEPLHELWLATPENGFHFQYNNQQWQDKRNHHELFALLSKTCSQHLGTTGTITF